jgi:transcriptional regulator with XRE-family HTH domain
MNVGSVAGWPGRQLLITQRLRDRRTDLGLTQKQVVTRLARRGVRTTNRALSSLEHGAGIDVAKLPELAAALDCTVTYLVGLTSEPHCWEPDQAPAERPSLGGASTAPRPGPRAAARGSSLIIGADVPDRTPTQHGGDGDG